MMRHARKSKSGLVVVLLLLIGAGIAYAERGRIQDWVAEAQKPDVEEVAYKDVANDVNVDTGGVPAPRQEEPAEPDPTPTDTPTNTQTSSTILPATFNLAVPFTSQAPKSIWEEPYQELCEEASILMASYYFAGKPAGKINPDEANEALLKIVDFENSFFGFYKDTTAEQTGILVEAMFNLTYDLIENPTVEEIKQAVVDGYPVIVPAAGRMLGNPNFTGAGPLYHMLVIKGYTEDGFITNDPGTRLGADYFYPFDTIMTAMHDWNDGDVDDGAKVVLIVKP